MAKIALLLLFSSMLILSIRPTVGDDNDEGNENTSEFSDATGERIVNSLDKAAEKVKRKATSLTEWVEGKLKDKSSSPATAQAPSLPRAFGPSRLMPIDDAVADSESGGQEETTIEQGGLLPPISSSRPFGPGTPIQIDSGGLNPEGTAPETVIDEGGLVPQDISPGTAIEEGGSMPQNLAPETTIDEGGLMPQNLAPGNPIDEGGLMPQDIAPGMAIDEGGLVSQDVAPGMAVDEGGLVPRDIAPGTAIDKGGLTADIPSAESVSAEDEPAEEGESETEN